MKNKIMSDFVCKKIEDCPNCERKLPNHEFLRRNGCKYCVPIKNTPYCNGKYD